ncbi:MAG: SMP-30/gluconolactonase/LRE family protein [Bacteroidales bacterium]
MKERAARSLAGHLGLASAFVAGVLAVAASHLVAAAPQKAATAQDLARTPVQTVWPLPPDEPRIRYVAVYRGASDIGAVTKSRTTSLKEALLGKDRVSPVQRDPNAFKKPFGVAIDGYGRIIVTDTAQASVVVMDPARRVFVSIGELTQEARFRVPVGVTVDQANNIYVGDNGVKRVLVFGPDLVYRSAVGQQDEMEAPSGVAVDDARQRLYVADSKKHALLVYNLATGKLQARIGKRGAEDAQFNFPTGVAVGPDGFVYVTDTMNYRVQVFGPDLSFVRAFGALGVNPGEFRRPKGIAVDADNVVYVVDSDYNNIQMFTPVGQPLMWVGQLGTRPGQLALPAGIAVSRQHRRIAVCEQYNRRVQVFERVGPAAR